MKRLVKYVVGKGLLNTNWLSPMAAYPTFQNTRCTNVAKRSHWVAYVIKRPYTPAFVKLYLIYYQYFDHLVAAVFFTKASN